MKPKATAINWTFALAAVLSLAVATPCAAELAATDLNPWDPGFSRAYAINAKGQIAGYAVDAVDTNYVSHALLWDRAGNMTALDPDEIFGHTEATAINKYGQVVGVWWVAANSSGAFVWDSVSGIMKDVGALTYNGVDDCCIKPSAISANGWVIGDSAYKSSDGYTRYRTWIYRDGTLEALTDANGQPIFAYAMNDAGQIAGSQQFEPFYPVIWEIPVGVSSPVVTVLSASSSDRPVAINASGQIALMGYSDIKIWRPDGTRNADGTLSGTLTSLLEIADYYPGADINFVGIDDSGRVYGTADIDNIYVRYHKVWVWQEGNITDVDAPGSLNSGNELRVNNSGQVVGSYPDPVECSSCWKSFLWNVGEASLVELEGLGGHETTVWAINDIGQVVGAAQASNYIHQHAAVWGPPTPVNQTPTLTVPASPLAGSVGSPVTFTATAIDPDEGDTLTFSLGANAPAGASIGAQSGVFTWTPTVAGTSTFDVSVSDAEGLSETKQVTVAVEDVVAVSALTFSNVTVTSPKPRSANITVTVVITNPSTTDTAYDVTVTDASLDGVDTKSVLPLVYGAIKPGSSKKCTLQFKSVPKGEQTLTINGTSSLGDFFLSQAVNVP